MPLCECPAACRGLPRRASRKEPRPLTEAGAYASLLGEMDWRGLTMRLVYLAMALLVAGVAMPAQAAAPDNTGTWLGKASQVGRDRTYTVTVTIGKKESTTAYPDLNCTGKLTRIGGSGSYVFYAEAIVNNKFDATKKKG